MLFKIYQKFGNWSINVLCCDPSSKLIRFIVLVLMCFFCFGSYFSYDNPAALQEYFLNDLKLSATQFSLLYSITSWSSIVFCFIGGFLIDRVFGLRVGTIIYLIILFISVSLFAFGAIISLYELMVISRFIFGIGNGSTIVAQGQYAALWFKGKEINMVFGFLISFSRIGSVINFAVMEPIYDYVLKFYQGYTGLGLALISGAIVCFISLTCGILLGWMDKTAEKNFKHINVTTGEVIKFSDIVKFNLSFWLVSFICVFYYVTIIPFISLAKVFFIEKWGYTSQQANTLNSTIYIISGIACPIFGFITDKIGNNIYFILLSILTSIVAHSLLAFTFFNPYISISLIGLSYSIFASSLWPLICVIIPKHQLGTGFGIAMSIQNAGLAIISLISGVIVDKGGYQYLEILFICSLIVCMFCGMLLLQHNRKTNSNLNMPHYQHKEIVTK